MRTLLHFAAYSIFLFFPLVAAASQDTAVIDIDDDQTIMAYYKAGLHPVHAVGLQRTRLEMSGGHLAIRLGGSNFGPFPVEYITVRMRNSQDPTQMNLSSMPMRANDAKVLLYEWADGFPMDRELIDEAITRILDPDSFRIAADLGLMVVGEERKLGKNIRMGIQLIRTYIEDGDESEIPFGIQIRIGVSYPSRSPSESPLQPADQPLRPPAGYEHLPMDRELAETMRHKERGAAALEQASGKKEEEPTAIPEQQNDASRNTSATAANAEVQGFIGSASFWLLSSALIICLIGWLAVRVRR